MITRKKLVLGIVTFILLAVCLPIVVKAQATLAPPPDLTDLTKLLVRTIDLAYAFGGTIFLILALVIGFQYMTSGADDKVIEESRQRIIYWVVGFILYFMSAAIVGGIYDILNVRDCNGLKVTPGFNLFLERSCGSAPLATTPALAPNSKQLYWSFITNSQYSYPKGPPLSCTLSFQPTSTSTVNIFNKFSDANTCHKALSEYYNGNGSSSGICGPITIPGTSPDWSTGTTGISDPLYKDKVCTCFKISKTYQPQSLTTLKSTVFTTTPNVTLYDYLKNTLCNYDPGN